MGYGIRYVLSRLCRDYIGTIGAFYGLPGHRNIVGLFQDYIRWYRDHDFACGVGPKVFSHSGFRLHDAGEVSGSRLR